MTKTQIPSSFRDPSGFVYLQNNEVYRQINQVYKDHYDLLMESGLYGKLVDKGLLVPHQEVPAAEASLNGDNDSVYKVISPEKIDFISYPYEWCFSQLKDAALATLRIQKIALNHGMTLKDASAYNIQFKNDRPILIDTLSFETYTEGRPWIAYRQFCQHFLAPLTLMSYTDVRLSQMLRIFIDGIPLDLAASLLPARTKLKFSLLAHIHLHAGSQKRHQHNTQKRAADAKVSRMGLTGIIDNLSSSIKKLTWKPHGTEWGDYYDGHNYSDDSLKHKEVLVDKFIDQIKPSAVWDLGANTGVFSRISAKRGIPTMSFDIDPAAVEKNYRQLRKEKETNLLPLLLDLTNPSPNLGWASNERTGFIERGPVDAILSLALIHHLAIGNNVPLSRVAHFYSTVCRSLIIEFVPKADSQVERMLSTREDVFPTYNIEGFEEAFAPYFDIEGKERVGESERTLFLMKNRGLV